MRKERKNFNFLPVKAARKYILIFSIIGIASFNSYVCAQVTIGGNLTPEKAALLDLKTKDGGNQGDISSDQGGILFPRVKIEVLTELGVFANIANTELSSDEQKKRHKGLSVYNIGSNSVEAGVYIWDGSRWQKAGIRKEINFFYMPSIKIDLNMTPPPTGIDLYDKYEKQFSNPKASSTVEPIPVLGRDDFHYYVTDYDEDIFDDVQVGPTGIMNYTLQSNLPTNVCCSYINIVFVVK